MHTRGRGDRIKRQAPTHRPSGGLADSLYEAKAAFRAAWEPSCTVRGNPQTRQTGAAIAAHGVF